MEINNADVAELVDARDLKSLDGNVVWVRVPPPAPSKKRVSRHRTKAAQCDAAMSAISPPPSSRPAIGWLWLAGAPATETVPEPMWGIAVGPVAMPCPVLGHRIEKRYRCAFWL